MDRIKQFEPFWDSWYVTGELGEGGFGKVYKIERKEFKNTYYAALKHIRVPQSSSEIRIIMDDGMDEKSVAAYFEEAVEDIVKEFVLMSRLKGNSNIVSYEDHKLIKDKDNISWDIFIRMELLTNLSDYLRENEITKRDIIKLGIDMCRALELCQKNNIIHRDIKPENIFVSENGDFKLGDFGIARQVEKTMSGLSKKGTFTYIAPEVYKGEAYGSSVDIYSLGLVMYRLLNNNRMPFMPPYPQPIKHSDRESALVKRIMGTEIPMPLNDNGRLAEIVLKACAYDPSQRYSSPHTMRMELEDIMYSERERTVIYPDGDKAEENSVHYVDDSKSEDDSYNDFETRTLGHDFYDNEAENSAEQYIEEIEEADNGIEDFDDENYEEEDDEIDAVDEIKELNQDEAKGGCININFDGDKQSKSDEASKRKGNGKPEDSFMMSVIRKSSNAPILLISAIWIIFIISCLLLLKSSHIFDNKLSDTDAESGSVIADSVNGSNTETSKMTAEIDDENTVQTWADNGITFTGYRVNGVIEGKGKAIYTDGSVYEGEWKNGKKNGNGIMEYSNGYKYDGEWKDDIREGKGTFTFPDGSIYEGEQSSNMLNGYGVKTFSNGDRYEGNWNSSTQNGQGTMLYSDGIKYEGNWLSGNRNGQGTMTWPNGDVYDGSWKDDNRTGKGVYTWSDGTVYEGNFVNGEISGYGVKTWPDGGKYEGDWKDDKRTGKGVYTWANGDRYDGSWKDDNRTGKGVYTWSDGTVYEGNFVNGEISGYGVKIWPDGKHYEGNWENSKANGQGKLTLADGTIYEGTFVNGEFVG